MQVLADAVLCTIDRIPGLALRTRHLDGRFKAPLRMLLAAVGLGFAAGAAVIGRAALHGYDDGTFGIVATIAIGAMDALLLVGGIGCVVRAVRKPQLAPLPDNVIPLHVVRSQAMSPTRPASIDEGPHAFGQLRDVD